MSKPLIILYVSSAEDLFNLKSIFFKKGNLRSSIRNFIKLKTIICLETWIRIKAIKTFKDLGFLQACLTNNFNSGDRDISALDDKNDERLKIMELFDFIIESKEVGIRKPNNEFYELALNRTKADPEKTIFLDDLGINLKPAKLLKISTIKVVSEQQALNELSDLTGITSIRR